MSNFVKSVIGLVITLGLIYFFVSNEIITETLGWLAALLTVYMFLKQIFLQYRQHSQPSAKQKSLPDHKPIPEPGPKKEIDQKMLEDIERVVNERAQPAIRLKRHWPPEEPYAGNSWLGGLPTLPPELAWPTNPKTGFRLHHLAQIDLGEMPQLESGPRLPEKGTLWFFADIDEELVWIDNPENYHSAVLYWPESVSGVLATDAPENLPEVNHVNNSMTRYSSSRRIPGFSVYSKWPVTGHKTLAWETFETKPKSVDNYLVYRKMKAEKTEALKQEICGAPAQSDPDKYAISEPIVDENASEQDRSFSRRERRYNPALWGYMFPYNNNLALKVVQIMLDDIVRRYESASRSIEYARKNERPPQEHDIQEIEAFGLWIVKLDELIASLKNKNPKSPLDHNDQKQIDWLMKECFNLSRLTPSAETYVYYAVVDLVAEAIFDPELLSQVPKEILELVHPTTLPSHKTAEHFLLGPKGGATNPTAGHGVRLAQFGSDYAVRFMFCDVGVVDFWIDEEDLERGRWDKAWAATVN